MSYTLQQHPYLRPAGGGPCLQCDQEDVRHEPVLSFISIMGREEESRRLNLPAWVVPLWDGIHAWTAGFTCPALKKHASELLKRGSVPRQADAVDLVELVVRRAVERAVEVERERCAAYLERKARVLHDGTQPLLLLYAEDMRKGCHVPTSGPGTA